jgi:hypothetical protein
VLSRKERKLLHIYKREKVTLANYINSNKSLKLKMI